MWTNKQFWLDATWRAFRTVCQTLAGVLGMYFLAVVLPLLQHPERIEVTPQPFGSPKLWAVFLFGALLAGAISLFQSIDRERAVTSSLPPVPLPLVPMLPAPPTPEQPASSAPAPAVSIVGATATAGAEDWRQLGDMMHGHGPGR